MTNTKSDLSPRESARELGVRLDGLYQLIWAGKLEARKRDGRWWIPREAIEARKRARRNSGRQKASA